MSTEKDTWSRPRSNSYGETTTDQRARAKVWNNIKEAANTSQPSNNAGVYKPCSSNRAKKRLAIGEYSIVAPLRNAGNGSGASLYLARHNTTEDHVVIKLVEKISSASKALRQLRKEALVMSCLQDLAKEDSSSSKKKSRVLSLIEVIEDSNQFCLVLPLAEEGDLFDFITKRRCLPREEAWRIFEQLVEGLSFAHSCGFIHRDIKPENIFLDADGDVLIGDWGYGTHWSSLSLKNRSCGSPNYVAGELLREAAYVGPEVDVFSLGVVFYACLTGNLPFGNSKRPDYAQRVKQGDWNDHPVLTPVERKLLDAMFQPNPLKRVTLYDVSQYLKEWRKRQTRYSVLSKGSNS